LLWRNLGIIRSHDIFTNQNRDCDDTKSLTRDVSRIRAELPF